MKQKEWKIMFDPFNASHKLVHMSCGLWVEEFKQTHWHIGHMRCSGCFKGVPSQIQQRLRNLRKLESEFT
jgi:hypothetical protein